MINLSGIKNIIFDLGGVILNLDYDKTSQAFKNLGFEDFDEFYSQKLQTSIFNELETGLINEKKFVEELQKHIPTINQMDIIEAWNEMLLNLPFERIRLIKSLSKHFRVYLLSNTNAIHYNSFINSIIKEHKEDVLTPCFKKVYYSHEIGFRKPNKDCFDFVLNDAGIVASETLFLDDSVQHVIGAKKCGINSFFVDVKKGKDIISLFPDITL